MTLKPVRSIKGVTFNHIRKSKLKTKYILVLYQKIYNQTFSFRDREMVEKRCYPDGKLGAIFHADGSGKVLYYSGETAMFFTESSLGMCSIWY